MKHDCGVHIVTITDAAGDVIETLSSKSGDVHLLDFIQELQRIHFTYENDGQLFVHSSTILITLDDEGVDGGGEELNPPSLLASQYAFQQVSPELH